MALLTDDWHATVRWLHVGAGIFWIGLLWWFNFVQWRVLKDLDDATKKQLTPRLFHWNLLFFRWAALGTWAFGAVLLWDVWSMGADAGNGYTARFRTILIGAWLGTFMLLNVWGIIWRYQKKNIAALLANLKDGTPMPPEAPTWTRKAMLASRVNTVLSFAMLYFMVGSTHMPRLADWVGGA